MDNEEIEGVNKEKSIEPQANVTESNYKKTSFQDIFNKEKANFITKSSITTYKLQGFFSLSEEGNINMSEEQCMTIRFGSSSNYIISGYSTGKLAIFNLKDNKTIFSKVSDFPITSVRWKPLSKTITLIVSSDGLITQIHSLTGKSLYQMKEVGNQIMCADYSNDGSSFATCGDDKTMRLYDDNTKMLITDFPTSSNKLPDIANRLFSVRFSPQDSNLLVGGGWDSTIHLFDIRQQSRVNYLYGPHICGDGIDIKDNLLLSTSWSGQDQVVLWDMRTMKAYMKMHVIVHGDKETNLYAGRFNPKSSSFAISGANRDVIRVYSYNRDFPENDIECLCDQLDNPCYCIDYCCEGNKMIYSGFDSMIRVVHITSNKSN